MTRENFWRKTQAWTNSNLATHWKLDLYSTKPSVAGSRKIHRKSYFLIRISIINIFLTIQFILLSFVVWSPCWGWEEIVERDIFYFSWQAPGSTVKTKISNIQNGRMERLWDWSSLYIYIKIFGKLTFYNTSGNRTNVRIYTILYWIQIFNISRERETPVLALNIKMTLCSKFTLKIVFAPFYLFVTFISCKLVKSSTFLPPFSL